MFIETTRHNVYSFLRKTGEIVPRFVEDDDFVWPFDHLESFTVMPDVDMFLLGITEQCNLRCTYCCYSGEYMNNRAHSSHLMNCRDIDEIYDFAESMATRRPLHIAFYGGEPLLNYDLLRHALLKAEERWNKKVVFSINTNATLLTEDRLLWLMEHHVKLEISIDGTQKFHDRYRKDQNGVGSFARLYNALALLVSKYPDYLSNVQLLMTLPSLDDLPLIAEEWNLDPVLSKVAPSHITDIAPNFAIGVEKSDYESLKTQYSELLELYGQHPDWAVLKAYLNSCICDWKNRPVVDAGNNVPMATCMPHNTKLYIDTDKQIAICEKISDNFRIGSVSEGIDWVKANEFVQAYYKKRVQRCSRCPAVRMCGLCLTAMEFDDEQWDVLCHNERTCNRLHFWLFCEMAERGMLSNQRFPKLKTGRCKLDAVGEDDIPALRAIFADGDTQQFLPELCDVVKTDDGIRQFINSFGTYLKNGVGVLWGIRYNDVLAGFVAIMDIPENPTIFYATDAQYRGNGIMKECVADVVGWFRDVHPALSLQTEVYKEHVASVKVLEHNGFQQCGEDDCKVYLKLLNS